MKIRIEKFYSIEMVKGSPQSLFIFGDNELGIGKGGQAIIRDYKNTFGIPTKRSPIDYWTDDTFQRNVDIISDKIENLKIVAPNYQNIIFPEQGIGTGRANMQQECPKTFLYLCLTLLDNFNFNNLQSLKSKQI